MHCTDFKLNHTIYNRYVYAFTAKAKNSLGGNNAWISLEPLTYYIHIKFYLFHQGSNEKPNYDERHCHIKYRNGSPFACKKINSLDSSRSAQRHLKVSVGRSWFLLHCAMRLVSRVYIHVLSKVHSFQST